MIRSFRSKALKRFWEKDDPRGLIAEHSEKIDRILSLLDIAKSPADMDVAGFYTHSLKGNRKGEWASTVRANWRITYSFDGNDAIDVDYEDYH